MLGELGIWLLGLMATAFGGSFLVGSWALIRSASRKQARLAILSFMSMAVITITSLFCALPFLKMHGSYSDRDRLIIIALVVANTALILFIARSLIRTIIGLDANMASASPTDPAAGTNRDRPETIRSSAKAASHRRIIGYLWLVTGGARLALLSYAILRHTPDLLDPDTALRLLPGAMLSLLALCGGYALLRNRPWSRWLCLPVSILSLTAVPVGTLTGGYYLWYFVTFEKPSGN